jgi:recombination protein RecT
MAKKTVLKRLLKYAPLKSDFVRAVTQDETIKSGISSDMYEISNEMVYETEYSEVDTETGEITDKEH